MTYRILRALARFLLLFQMRLRVSGTERCPREGPLMIVGNHLGLLDPLAIGVRVPRRIRILAKSEVSQWPVIGWLARLGAVVPARRGTSDREAMRTLEQVLSAGGCVLVMPEGTFPKVPLPAAMLPVKTGAAYLALRTGATVWPVGITGTERVWYRARGWKLWHRPRVTVQFGEPYRPHPPDGLAPKATYQWVAEEMAERIAALLPEQYRGRYGTSRDGLAHAERTREHGDIQ